MVTLSHKAPVLFFAMLACAVSSPALAIDGAAIASALQNVGQSIMDSKSQDDANWINSANLPAPDVYNSPRLTQAYAPKATAMPATVHGHHAKAHEEARRHGTEHYAHNRTHWGQSPYDNRRMEQKKRVDTHYRQIAMLRDRH